MQARIKQSLRVIFPPFLYRRMALFKYCCSYYFNMLFGYNEFCVDNDYERYWDKKLKAKSYKQYSQRRAKKFEAIAKLVEKGDSVVDVGCGDGVLLERLRNEKITSDVLGIDISENALSACRKKGILTKQIDVFHTDFVKEIENYDYLVMSDSIEHISNPEVLLASLEQKIKKGIIISIPNTGFFIYRLRLLFGKFPMQWSKGEFMGVHLRFWTFRDFKWWSRNLGFMIKRFVPVQGVPLLKRIWPNLFSNVMIFLLVDKIEERKQ